MCKRGFLIYRYCLRLLEFIICIYPYLFIYKYVRSLWCLEGLFSSMFFVSFCIFINSEIYWSPFICAHSWFFKISPEKFVSSISSSILFMFFYFFPNSYSFFIYLCNNPVSLWAFGVSHFGGERTLRNVIFGSSNFANLNSPTEIRQLGTSTLGVLYPFVDAVYGIPFGHYNISWRGLAALLILGRKAMRRPEDLG
jgi:hypothetical protein